MKPQKSSAFQILGRVLLAIPLGYIVGFLLCFNLAIPGLAFDEDNVIDPVSGTATRCAYGPKPYWLLCRPSYHDVVYDGNEWAFVFFRPLCRAWLFCAGYCEAHHHPIYTE